MPGYAYNRHLSGDTNAQGAPLYTKDAEDVAYPDSKVSFPSVTVAVSDSAVGELVAVGPNNHYYTKDLPLLLERGWERHSGGANYLFCDGHIKWYTEPNMGYKRFNSTMAAFGTQVEDPALYPGGR